MVLVIALWLLWAPDADPDPALAPSWLVVVSGFGWVVVGVGVVLLESLTPSALRTGISELEADSVLLDVVIALCWIEF